MKTLFSYMPQIAYGAGGSGGGSSKSSAPRPTGFADQASRMANSQRQLGAPQMPGFNLENQKNVPSVAKRTSQRDSTPINVGTGGFNGMFTKTPKSGSASQSVFQQAAQEPKTNNRLDLSGIGGTTNEAYTFTPSSRFSSGKPNMKDMMGAAGINDLETFYKSNPSSQWSKVTGGLAKERYGKTGENLSDGQWQQKINDPNYQYQLRGGVKSVMGQPTVGGAPQSTIGRPSAGGKGGSGPKRQGTSSPVSLPRMPDQPVSLPRMPDQSGQLPMGPLPSAPSAPSAPSVGEPGRRPKQLPPSVIFDDFIPRNADGTPKYTDANGNPLRRNPNPTPPKRPVMPQRPTAPAPGLPGRPSVPQRPGLPQRPVNGGKGGGAAPRPPVMVDPLNPIAAPDPVNPLQQIATGRQQQFPTGPRTYAPGTAGGSYQRGGWSSQPVAPQYGGKGGGQNPMQTLRGRPSTGVRIQRPRY